MSGPEDGPARPSTTEDVPAAPGWVETGVDALFAALPVSAAALKPMRDSYLDCLAASRGPADVDIAHDACRRGLLAALHAAHGFDSAVLSTLERGLEALEADLSANL